MIDITERGHDALKSLYRQHYYKLSSREKTDLAILHHVWNERELAGGPIDSVDVSVVARVLKKLNPLWFFGATRDRIINTIPKLVFAKLLEED